MASENNEYTKRIDRVIDYLRANLDRPHTLGELARVACLSEFHFHRIFTSLTGETLNDFTNRLRLEKAARLLTRSGRRVTDIAFECGFSSPAAFARSFRHVFETTPTEYRRSKKVRNSKICKDLFEKSEYILPMSGEEKRVAFPVEVRSVPARDIAYIRVSDAFQPGKVIDAFRRLIEWAKAEAIFDEGILFGMSVDDPAVTPKKLYRYEACFVPNAEFICPSGISRMTMPSRKYAVTRAAGDLKWIATATDYLSRIWPLENGYEREHSPGLEIFIDKEKALDWERFDLELAVPVTKLHVLED